MKEVMAIIRMNKMNETKKALTKAGFPSMTATGRVLGRGKGYVDYKLLEGAAKGHPEAISQLSGSPKMMAKRLIIMVVKDENVEKVVSTLIQVNKTGNPGDGKIFVSPVSDSYRVRTGEHGDITLD